MFPCDFVLGTGKGDIGLGDRTRLRFQKSPRNGNYSAVTSRQGDGDSPGISERIGGLQDSDETRDGGGVVREVSD